MKLIGAHQFNLVQNFIWRKCRFKLFFKKWCWEGLWIWTVLFELLDIQNGLDKKKINWLVLYIYTVSGGEKITPTLTFSIRVLITESGLYNTSSSRIQSINLCMKVFSRHLLGPNDWTTSRTEPPNPPKLMIDLGKNKTLFTIHLIILNWNLNN
jgi:hypothetical protein